MGNNWRPHNKFPFPSRGPFGGEWNRHSLRKCIHCGKATTLEPALHPWCKEAHLNEVKRQQKRQQKLQKKKEAQRERSGKPTKAEWKRLRNLTMAEWQQEKKEWAERKRTEQKQREQ